MRILAIDVGMGTADILAYDSAMEMENCHRLVIPARTMSVAARISEATAAGRAVVFDGATMGGGPCGKALKKHLQAGLGFYASPAAALTFNDDLDRVSSWGVHITDEPGACAPSHSLSIFSGDIDLPVLLGAFRQLDMDTGFDGYAVAVQDHGFSPGASNRRHRFQLWRRALTADAGLENLAFSAGNIPGEYTRMRAVASLLGKQPEVVLMDTGPAALWGALTDESTGYADAAPQGSRMLIVANVGNGHTLAAILRGQEIQGLVEHHTGLLDARSFGEMLRRFAAGNLSDEEVFSDGGHGCIPPDSGMDITEPVLVTGPRRHEMMDCGLPLRLAAPHGDMMLTGCFGLLEAWKSVNADPSS